MKFIFWLQLGAIQNKKIDAERPPPGKILTDELGEVSTWKRRVQVNNARMQDGSTMITGGAPKLCRAVSSSLDRFEQWFFSHILMVKMSNLLIFQTCHEPLETF